MQSRNNLKDVANKAMKSMSKQVTPILHLHSGIVEICLKWMWGGGEWKDFFYFLGQKTKSAVTDVSIFQVRWSMIGVIVFSFQLMKVLKDLWVYSFR